MKERMSECQPPLIRNLYSNGPITVRHGEPLELSVQVVGLPPPQVKWYIGPWKVVPSRQYTIRKDGITHTLRISRVQEEGDVSVLAVNEVGEDKAVINLKVYKVLNSQKCSAGSDSHEDEVLIIWRRRKFYSSLQYESSTSSLSRSFSTESESPPYTSSPNQGRRYDGGTSSSSDVLNTTLNKDLNATRASNASSDWDSGFEDSFRHKKQQQPLQPRNVNKKLVHKKGRSPPLAWEDFSIDDSDETEEEAAVRYKAKNGYYPYRTQQEDVVIVGAVTNGNFSKPIQPFKPKAETRGLSKLQSLSYVSQEPSRREPKQGQFVSLPSVVVSHHDDGHDTVNEPNNQLELHSSQPVTQYERKNVIVPKISVTDDDDKKKDATQHPPRVYTHTDIDAAIENFFSTDDEEDKTEIFPKRKSHTLPKAVTKKTDSGYYETAFDGDAEGGDSSSCCHSDRKRNKPKRSLSNSFRKAFPSMFERFRKEKEKDKNKDSAKEDTSSKPVKRSKSEVPSKRGQFLPAVKFFSRNKNRKKNNSDALKEELTDKGTDSQDVVMREKSPAKTLLHNNGLLETSFDVEDEQVHNKRHTIAIMPIQEEDLVNSSSLFRESRSSGDILDDGIQYLPTAKEFFGRPPSEFDVENSHGSLTSTNCSAEEIQERLCPPIHISELLESPRPLHRRSLTDLSTPDGMDDSAYYNEEDDIVVEMSRSPGLYNLKGIADGSDKPPPKPPRAKYNTKYPWHSTRDTTTAIKEEENSVDGNSHGLYGTYSPDEEEVLTLEALHCLRRRHKLKEEAPDQEKSSTAEEKSLQPASQRRSYCQKFSLYIGVLLFIGFLMTMAEVAQVALTGEGLFL